MQVLIRGFNRERVICPGRALEGAGICSHDMSQFSKVTALLTALINPRGCKGKQKQEACTMHAKNFCTFTMETSLEVTELSALRASLFSKRLAQDHIFVQG